MPRSVRWSMWYAWLSQFHPIPWPLISTSLKFSACGYASVALTWTAKSAL